MELKQLVERLARGSSGKVTALEHGTWKTRDGFEVVAAVQKQVSRLQALGVRPGMRVAIVGPNSFAWIVADLCLLELGCVSVPIPDALEPELDELAEQHGLVLALAPRASDDPRPWVVPFDGDEPGPALRDVDAKQPDPDAFDVPTLAFSSGTSGSLKCLEITRSGMEHVVRSFARAYALEERDSVLVFLPLSNLQQRLMAYGALWFGLEVVVVPAVSLFRALREQRPTILIGPPLLYETIHRRYLDLPPPKRWLGSAVMALARPLPSALRDRILRRAFEPIYSGLGSRVRLMITGMAHIRSSTLRFFEAVGLPLFEAYGLTECGLVAGNTPTATRIGSVGKPFEAGTVELDADGEIVVRRALPLARGYVGDSDEQQTFGDGCIRTGDIGHFDGDGFLYITGRKKQIIVTAGGSKIHPEIVENQINDCPVVDRSAVFGSDGQAFLSAVVTVRATETPEQRKLVLEHVRGVSEKLPSGTQIERIVISDAPFSVDNGTLTRNLKLNRQRILEAYAEQLRSATL